MLRNQTWRWQSYVASYDLVRRTKASVSSPRFFVCRVLLWKKWRRQRRKYYLKTNRRNLQSVATNSTAPPISVRYRIYRKLKSLRWILLCSRPLEIASVLFDMKTRLILQSRRGVFDADMSSSLLGFLKGHVTTFSNYLSHFMTAFLQLRHLISFVTWMMTPSLQTSQLFSTHFRWNKKRPPAIEQLRPTMRQPQKTKTKRSEIMRPSISPIFFLGYVLLF